MKRRMTDEEFIAALTDCCRPIDVFPSAWFNRSSKIRELMSEPQFKEWFYKALGPDGISHDDEWWMYHAESNLERELGGRIGWFSDLDCYGVFETIDITEPGDFFYTKAHAFDFENEKYWVLTMVGQGAISWFMTDEKFQEIRKQDIKKQYHLSEHGFKSRIVLYHDGVRTDIVEKWQDELDEYVDYLESQGYTRGYVRKEVEEAEAQFKYLRDNQIKE